ncbi:MAG: MBL fold metallo-hydrolase [Candidatus Thorarchaeota archaeon]|jgi:glyoxylase-like metal-dependent hydrolase (beta-lactamase superfamily II)
MSDYEVHLEIEDKVHLIRGKNKARFPEANCLLIDDEELTLIDAGASIENIDRTLKDLGHSIGDINQIILTHFHIDHKGYAGQIQRSSDCEIICHPLAEKGVATFEGLVELIGIDSHKRYNAWENYLESKVSHVKSSYKVNGHFKESKPISCGEIELIPIHAPGHSFDHTVFGINGLDTLFLVDIDLTSFGPWYGNAVSDISDFRNSMERIIELEPSLGISSHLIDPVEEGLLDRLKQYLEAFDLRDQQIIQYISEGHSTIEELATIPTIYPNLPSVIFLTFEEFMIEKHVEDLESKGVLEKGSDGIISLL